MADTKVKFEGKTRDFNQGGNAVAGSSESHGSSRAKGQRVGQDAKISRRLDAGTDSTLEASKVTGTKRREIGPAEAVRRANNHARDGRTNLGTGKPSEVVTD
jgi:hypothetical protein